MGAASSPSLRETLTAAFDEAAEEPAPLQTSATEPAVEEPAAALETEAKSGEQPAADAPLSEGERPRNQDGTFKEARKVRPPAPAKAAQASAAEAKTVPPVPVAPKAPAAVPAAAVPGEAPAALKAPVSWKPQAREKWVGLPPEVQAEVVRVDGEVRRVMQEGAARVRALDAVQRTLQPFDQMIRAEGHQPLQAVESLLRQAHLMRFGAPAAKVEFVEGLIERNQVPVDAALVARLVQKHRVPIDALVDALEGKPSAPGQAQPSQAFDANAIVQQVMSAVDQREQAREQRLQQQEFTRLKSDGETFIAQQEFGEDVRDDMADVLERAARRGTPMTLEQAYKRALQIHPEVSETLKQRADAEAAKAKVASTQKARAAAGSVKNQPAGAPPASKAKGLRGALEAAWDEQMEQP